MSFHLVMVIECFPYFPSNKCEPLFHVEHGARFLPRMGWDW
jgi:hypothetical protein